MDESLRYKVLYLLSIGWTDTVKIQQALNIEDEEMKSIVEWLFANNYLVKHTVH